MEASVDSLPSSFKSATAAFQTYGRNLVTINGDVI